MNKIPTRLLKIANYIDDGTSVVDVGCDHALLDIYLATSKKNMTITASDVNENALNNAKNNIKKYKLEKKIATVLSKGLDNIDTKDVDTIVVSGMGAHTIVGIFYNNLKKIKKVNQLILQSNNDIDFLRYKMTKIGYYIAKEELVKEQEIIYTIVVFKRGYRFYSKKQIYFGPFLLKEKSSLFKEKCKLELNKMENFYPKIPKNCYLYKHKIMWRIKNLKKILN